MEQLYVTTSKTPKKLAINPLFNADPFYRYQMPQLIVEITKGKTRLINLDEVSKSLKVDPLYISRYFGGTLGTQVKHNGKSPVEISGTFDNERLSLILVNFIQKFILCPDCDMPELNKKGNTLLCQACGWNGKIDKMDLPESFKKYVVSH